MKIENTSRARLIIAASVMSDCNEAKLELPAYREMFIELYNQRTGDSNGAELFEYLINHVTEA